MIRLGPDDIGGVDMGAMESLAEIAKAKGLHLRATAFDQIEVSPWPHPGVHCGPEVRTMMTAMLERRISSREPAAPRM